ncbi:MAG: YggS family pyridoxal phosphate-dependent enzyme [Verrucomicrobiales bacterium]|nr:YggS family pyridoxal phosphate-dependent enzyme [Verrucomicrobiales bacterium]
MPSTLTDRLHSLRTRIATATARAGRPAGSVELLAVSKTFPASLIAEAAATGQTLFGENRVQEALAKIPKLPPTLRWHLIGHLQSNKIRKILPYVEAIHSVDSLKLARDIQRIATELDLHPAIYLEVNLGQESSKSGFSADTLPIHLPELLTLDRLRILGLMAIPPWQPDPEASRPAFAQLRQLRDQLTHQTHHPLPGLSMGMSHDFEVAIEEGATIVRVGSALFGER